MMVLSRSKRVMAAGLRRAARVTVALLMACGATAFDSAPLKAPDRAESDAAGRAQVNAAVTKMIQDASARESLPGAKLFADHCAACHLGGVEKAPSPAMIGMMTPEAVVSTITTGIMQAQGSSLSPAERLQVAEYLTGSKLGEGDRFPAPKCSGAAARFDFNAPPGVVGWGFDARGTHFIPAAAAHLPAAAAPRLKLKWAFAYPGANRARSQPATAGGAIIVGSHNGEVLALDQQTGCVRWTYTALSEVRTGIVVSPWKAGDMSARPMASFGDLLGNVYVVDVQTGKLIWRDRPDGFPTATITGAPTLYKGRLYVPISSLEELVALDPKYPCCRFRGSLVAYEFATGRRLWRTYMVNRAASLQGKNKAHTDAFGPSGGAIWNSPVVDEARHQLLFATGDNYSDPPTRMSDAVVALDLDDGRVKWVYQATAEDVWNGGCTLLLPSCTHPTAPDFDFGAGVILARAGGGRDLVLAGQKSGEVFAIDPATGALMWRRRLGRGGAQGGVHFGMAVAGQRLFVPISDMPWGHNMQGQPHPGLYALDIRTGKLLWSTPGPFGVCGGRDLCFPGISAAIAASPGLVYAGGMDGVLRIYDAATGRVVWSYDTTREVKTVSGAVAFGGAIGGGAAPIISGGMLFTNSGYGANMHMPGRLLLAFGVE